MITACLLGLGGHESQAQVREDGSEESGLEDEKISCIKM